jgi:hypothetical protein
VLTVKIETREGYQRILEATEVEFYRETPGDETECSYVEISEPGGSEPRRTRIKEESSGTVVYVMNGGGKTISVFYLS